MNSRDWARFQAAVKAATGVKHTHRIYMAKTLSTAGNNAIPLIAADDDPDYDLDGNGNQYMECETNARITGIDLFLTLRFLAAGRTAEVIIYKDPDQILGTQAPSELFDNDATGNNMLLRKYTVAYGFFIGQTNLEARQLRIRISRAALRRAGVMKDGDQLKMVVQTSAGTDNLLYAQGRIWTRK